MGNTDCTILRQDFNMVLRDPAMQGLKDKKLCGSRGIWLVGKLRAGYNRGRQVSSR